MHSLYQPTNQAILFVSLGKYAKKIHDAVNKLSMNYDCRITLSHIIKQDLFYVHRSHTAQISGLLCKKKNKTIFNYKKYATKK